MGAHSCGVEDTERDGCEGKRRQTLCLRQMTSHNSFQLFWQQKGVDADVLVAQKLPHWWSFTWLLFIHHTSLCLLTPELEFKAVSGVFHLPTSSLIITVLNWTESFAYEVFWSLEKTRLKEMYIFHLTPSWFVQRIKLRSNGTAAWRKNCCLFSVQPIQRYCTNEAIR